MQKKEPGVWFRRVYVDVLDGDIQAALMLSQIAYWYAAGETGLSKLRVNKHGTKWLVKSAVHWHEELGLSEKQSRRCVEVLRSIGLIETCVHRFAGSPMTHIRLTNKGHEIVNCPSGKFHSPSGANPTFHQGVSITETVAKSTTENEPAGKPAKHPGEGEEGKDTKEKVEGDKEESGANANALAIASIWKKRMADSFPGTQKALAKKEYGQLKQFQQKLADQAAPVLEFALGNWIKFGWRARSNAGLASYPATPNIGFLLCHYDSVLELMMEEVSAKSPAAQVKWDGSSLAQPAAAAANTQPELSYDEPPAKFTPEMIAAELAEFYPVPIAQKQTLAKDP